MGARAATELPAAPIKVYPTLEDWTWDALGLPGWFISSGPVIRSLWNHILVQITGLVSEPITPESGLSSWHRLAGITHLSGDRSLPCITTPSMFQHVHTSPDEPTRRTLPDILRNTVESLS